jgi:dihydropteroate synthase
MKSLENSKNLKKLNLPILAGISRKSMIYNLLNVTSEEALNGTTVANTISLLNGANILRVHDVKEAVECIRIYEMIR